jgi:hypothetical protein
MMGGEIIIALAAIGFGACAQFDNVPIIRFIGVCGILSGVMILLGYN